MKTSNKLLLTAVLFLLASLAAYNMTLKNEFNKGTYKDPYKNHTALSFRGFDELEINPGSICKVNISKGPYAVWVRSSAVDFVQVKQTGKRLRLDVAFPAEKGSPRNAPTLMISCPQLNVLSTNALYSVNGKPTIDKAIKPSQSFAVTVSGFAQDSLLVRQDNASIVKLVDNKLGLLRAVAGLSPGSGSSLQVLPSNRIIAANLDIRHKSQLILEGTTIPQLYYQFADSATATMSGATLSALTR